MIDPKTIEELNEKFKGKSPEEVLSYFYEIYYGSVAFATSLGAEDQVITHMISNIDKKANVFTLDTGRLFPETYDLLDKTTKQTGINIKVLFPDAKKVEKMVKDNGINLFYDSVESRKLCCQIRKIEPLKRALAGVDVWITGLRAGQSVTRSDNRLIEWSQEYTMVKINPLAYWSEEQVWQYIKENNLPYNPLHDKGFPSIGCQPCTRAIEAGEDIRAGRWWWELPEHKECGLHNRPIK